MTFLKDYKSDTLCRFTRPEHNGSVTHEGTIRRDFTCLDNTAQVKSTVNNVAGCTIVVELKETMQAAPPTVFDDNY